MFGSAKSQTNPESPLRISTVKPNSPVIGSSSTNLTFLKYKLNEIKYQDQRLQTGIEQTRQKLLKNINQQVQNRVSARIIRPDAHNGNFNQINLCAHTNIISNGPVTPQAVVNSYGNLTPTSAPQLPSQSLQSPTHTQNPKTIQIIRNISHPLTPQIQRPPNQLSGSSACIIGRQPTLHPITQKDTIIQDQASTISKLQFQIRQLNNIKELMNIYLFKYIYVQLLIQLCLMIEQAQKSECDICCNKITKKEESPLTCGHTLFHLKCLGKTWEVKIKQSITPLKCPICAIEIQYSVLQKILSPHYMQLYDKLMLTNALLLDQNMFFCPTPNCVNISEIIPPETEQQRFFYCRQCFKGFCLICRQPFHQQQKCQFQYGQITVIKDYQQCPKCQSKFFKTQGCNIVECKICKLEFCYDCQGKDCKPFRCKEKEKKNKENLKDKQFANQ